MLWAVSGRDTWLKKKQFKINKINKINTRREAVDENEHGTKNSIVKSFATK
jgi:hypothetical protein